MISLLGAFSAYFIYSFGLEYFYTIKKTKSFKLIYNFLNRKWYFDRLYNEFIGQNALNLSYHYSYKDIDRGIIEKLGPSGIVNSIRFVFNYITVLQSGLIYHYLFLFLFCTILFIFVSICFSNLLVSLNIMLFLFFLIFFI